MGCRQRSHSFRQVEQEHSRSGLLYEFSVQFGVISRAPLCAGLGEEYTASERKIWRRVGFSELIDTATLEQ